jgi:hypothetical protein
VRRLHALQAVLLANVPKGQRVTLMVKVDSDSEAKVGNMLLVLVLKA